MKVSDYFSAELSRINPFLEQQLQLSSTEDSRLKLAVAYSLLAGGKRVRPLLVYATADALDVPLEQAALNARFVAELCESDVPVYSGADKPLLRPYVDATWFHGADGLSGYAEIPTQRPETTHAVDALISASHQYENLVLVTLGPLTNIALAVARDPSIIPKISRCVVMGGAACTYGNVTPAAEYNIWVDPDAARMVFLSGLPIEMVESSEAESSSSSVVKGPSFFMHWSSSGPLTMRHSK